jgi:hypothetical protein
MSQIFLRSKLQELCKSGATLLWLEGAKHETVLGVKLSGNKLILQLHGNVMRMVSFDRYTTTKVGLQFWNQDKPGVLYKWDQVPAGPTPVHTAAVLKFADRDGSVAQFDEDPPPNKAA